MDFEEKILKHEIMAKSSSTEADGAFHWEDSSNCSQDGSKERLVIKFRRITGSYYMVDDIPDSPDSPFKYFNYKSQRYSFPTYLTVAPSYSSPAKKAAAGGSPKVYRCKTCRKVFSKMSTLKVHRKTHAAFAPAGTFTPGDFAKRFSSEKVSRVS